MITISLWTLPIGSHITHSYIDRGFRSSSMYVCREREREREGEEKIQRDKDKTRVKEVGKLDKNGYKVSKEPMGIRKLQRERKVYAGSTKRKVTMREREREREREECE